MSLKETIASRVTEYLESTTIHGFSYLTGGRHICERVTWLIIIGTCFTLAALLIHQSIEEANQNPVMTNVESIPLQDIPFPAITINIGDPDPLGYAENTFNGLIFDQGLPEAKELRNIFSNAIDDIVYQLNSSFRIRNSRYIPQGFIDLIVPYLRGFCLNYPDKKELIDQKITVFSRELILDGRYIEDLFFEDIATIDLDYEYVGNISNTSVSYSSCEKWAGHLVFFFYNLYQNQQSGSQKTTRIGFGSFVAYFDSLSKFSTNTNVPHNFSQFLSKYSKLTGLSEVLERMNVTSFDFVAWMSNWLRLNNFELDGWRKNCPGIEERFMALCHTLPDFRQKYSQCCDIFSFESLNMSSVYQIMRESMQSPMYLTNPQEVIERQNVIASFPFPNVLQNDELTEIFLKTNPNARVYACNYARENNEFGNLEFRKSMSCPHFHRSITSNGFGISFNVADFWSVYKESPFTKTFVEVMKPKTNPPHKPNNLANDQHLLHRGKNILFPEKLGKSNEMLVVLQSRWTREQKTSEKFQLSIHDPLQIPNMLDAGDEILPGALTSINVWPQLIETSNNLVSHTIEERGCQFNFEGSSQLFTNNYHQEGCIFECLLELSYSTMNCTPWNYPFFKPHQQTCNFYAVFHFEEQMRSSSNINQCQAKCPQECTKMLYTASISSEPFDWQGMCEDKNDNYRLYFDPNPFYQYSQPIGILKSYEQMVFNKNMSYLEFCKETLKRIAVVRIKLASNTVTAIKRSKRVTITGHIANIGGTLGLFTGMSIMSFIELTFWLCRFLHSLKWHRS